MISYITNANKGGFVLAVAIATPWSLQIGEAIHNLGKHHDCASEHGLAPYFYDPPHMQTLPLPSTHDVN